ncbi:MAG TPA: hypothetical protein V6D18_12945 [Thermosynechococcaceae cyanobacterium]
MSSRPHRICLTTGETHWWMVSRLNREVFSQVLANLLALREGSLFRQFKSLDGVVFGQALLG